VIFSSASSRTAALLAAIASLTLCDTPAQAGGDWVNDWFDQATTTAPGRYQSQQRGYYTAGGFDARLRMGNDYLLSVQPPSIKVGCGGIDLMAGSLSYLNPEYVVQKMERILQSAPAFAFDLAMQEFCKPCTASLQFLEHTADTLNGLQLNDCEATRKLATAIVEPQTIGPELQGLADSAQAIGNGLSDSWEKFQTDTRAGNGSSPTPATDAVQGCPAEFTKIFTHGSVMQNTASLVGLDSYAPLMRGLIGDVVVNFNAATNNYGFSYLTACPGNDSVTGEDFASGSVAVEDATGKCTQPGFTSVVSTVDTKLNGIATALKAGTPLNAAQQSFISQAPIPLYLVLRDATQAGNETSMIGLLDDSLAKAYTAQILSDFYQATQQVFDLAQQAARNTAQSGGGNTNTCDVTLLAPAMTQLDTLKDQALRFRGLAQQAYAKAAGEAVSELQLTRRLYELHVQQLNATANQADRDKPQ
jgi:conjugative transfer pilus assembly protein TraH